MEFLLSNYEWMFSGVGIVFLGYIWKKVNSRNKEVELDYSTTNSNNTIDSNNITNSNNTIDSNNITKSNNTTDSNNTTNSSNTIINNIEIGDQLKSESKHFKTVIEAQNNIKILFIDDDTKFKVVNILKSAGWKNTRIIKDISNLDAHDIQETDIFFVDIQGVGKKLLFQDEGLGLANALKNKYLDKKVVIYSAVSSGDRFHEALNKADGRLSKNADPFQFQQLIESLSVR